MHATRAAEAFRDALLARDFGGLERTLARDTNMRALLPGGPREAIVGAFEAWFGGAVDFEPVPGRSETIGGRVRVGWLARMRRDPDGPPVVIEQPALVDADGDTVHGIDLPGFQEAPVEAAVAPGQVYDLPPGHRFRVVEACELVEFTPTGAGYEQTMEAFQKHTSAWVAKQRRPVRGTEGGS